MRLSHSKKESNHSGAQSSSLHAGRPPIGGRVDREDAIDVLADVLTLISVHVVTTGAAAGTVDADSMARAIVDCLDYFKGCEIRMIND